MFGICNRQAPSFERSTEAVIRNRTIALKKNCTTSRSLSVRESFSLATARSRLEQYIAERDVCIHVGGIKSCRLAISLFRLFPALLISINVSDPIGSTPITPVQTDSSLVGFFGVNKLL